jgi:hypothetical protein
VITASTTTGLALKSAGYTFPRSDFRTVLWPSGTPASFTVRGIRFGQEVDWEIPAPANGEWRVLPTKWRLELQREDRDGRSVMIAGDTVKVEVKLPVVEGDLMADFLNAGGKTFCLLSNVEEGRTKRGLVAWAELPE